MTGEPRPRLTVQRAAARYRSRPVPGVSTRHAFSFSGHYDPANTHLGVLLACNEETLAAGAGFDDHRHRDVEIFTWVLEGALEHRDSRGGTAVVRPGVVQYLGAGSGVVHSERNASGAPGPVRFVQMWLLPDVLGAEPRHLVRDAPAALARPALAEGLVPLASGRAADAAPVRLRRSDAALWAGRLPADAVVTGLPAAPWLYLHVARGRLHADVSLDDGGGERVPLGAGDAVRIEAGGLDLVSSGPEGAEVLLWEMHSGLGPG